MKRVWREYDALKRWAGSQGSTSIVQLQSCSLDNDDDEAATASASAFYTIQALIYPTSEPFKKKSVKIEIQVPHAYPHDPPKVYLKTKLSHPNVAPNGHMCTGFLEIEKLYEPKSLSDVIKLIVDILDKPEIGYFFDEQAGKLYQSDPEKYNQSISQAVIANLPR